MRIIKIDDMRIRCIMSRIEAAERNFSCYDLSMNTPKADKLREDILNLAFEQYGFVTDGYDLEVTFGTDDLGHVILDLEKVLPEMDGNEIIPFSPRVDNYREQKCDSYIYQNKVACIEFDNDVETIIDFNQASLSRLYRFHDFDSICRLSKVLGRSFETENSICKDKEHYLLFLHFTNDCCKELSDFEMRISDYAEELSYSACKEAYYVEKNSMIIERNALQQLAAI